VRDAGEVVNMDGPGPENAGMGRDMHEITDFQISRHGDDTEGVDAHMGADSDLRATDEDAGRMNSNVLAEGREPEALELGSGKICRVMHFRKGAWDL